jgi:hypothetical protein
MNQMALFYYTRPMLSQIMFLAQKNNALKYVLYPVPIMEERGDKF